MAFSLKNPWLRNLLFLGLCLVGLAAVTDRLLSRNRIQPPRDPEAGVVRRDDFQQTLAAINQEFRDSWTKRQLLHAERADHLTIARRLSLGLAGTIPSVEEIRALEAQPPDQRTEWFVSHLLSDRRSADYLAERLARAYVGTENGPFLVYRRRRFVTWLSDRLHENTCYDQLVRELIADTGLWTSSPAVNFVTVTLDQNQGNQPDEIRLAARTTRAFLGMRIDCLQCHDDRLGKFTFTDDQGNTHGGTQRDFHQLAAFYAEARQTPTGVRDKSGEMYRYRYLNAEDETTVEPSPPFLKELVPQGGTKREQLARWVTHPENRMFARATVNRIWAIMVGRPLLEPIDDLPLESTYYPPALETLATDFIEHGYNLRRLIRLIALSDVYQLDSRADFEITEAHEDHWAVFPLSRLRPEQVAGSMIQASSLKTIDANAHILWQLAKFDQTNEFVKRYGDMGEDEFEDRGGTITQRLLLMNGALAKERTTENPLVNAVTRLPMVADDAAAIEASYLAVLTRRPTADEKQLFLAAVSKDKAARAQAFEDLYWVLLNSTEFSWNH
jgi:hypothetical protein